MRICIINEFFFPDNTGGTGTVLSNLARELHDRYEDVEIDVITSRNQYRVKDKPLPTREQWNGINIFRLSSPKSNVTSVKRRLLANLCFSVAALAKLMHRKRYDVVLIGTAPPPAPMTAWIYRMLRGTPFVYITYDLEPDRAVALGAMKENSLAVRFGRRLQRAWLHASSQVVVLGRCMHDHIASTYALAPHQITTIPIGFDPKQVVPGDKQTKFRAENQLEDFVVLYAGNFGRYHNFDTILDAAKMLQIRGEQVTFALVGQGAQKAHIQQRIASEGITNVRLFPFVPLEEFSDMLASADVLLVTLEKEAEGLCVPSKLYSNLAAGRPTIGMVGAKSEVGRVLLETESGMQVDQHDAECLAASVMHLAHHPEKVERMGFNARKALEERFATRHIASLYYSVLHRAASAELSPRQVETALSVPDRAIVRAINLTEERNCADVEVVP